MTMRDKMTNSGENLGRCKPISFNDGEIIIALNDGAVVGIRDHGADLPCGLDGYTDDQIKAVARRVNGDYDLYSGWDDVHIICDAGGEELPCSECPWFGVCAAMDEELDQEEPAGAAVVYIPDDCPGYGYGEDPVCTDLAEAQALALEWEAQYKTEITVSEYRVDSDPDSIEPLSFTGRWWTWTGSGWVEQ